MLKRIFLIAASIFAFAGVAFAATDLNTADKAALDGVKTIGPKTADAIIAERSKSGKFKDWDDFIRRVKGVGPKNAEKMSASGLTINGVALANAPAAVESAKKAPKAAKEKPAAAAADAAPADKKTVTSEPAAAAKPAEKVKEKK